MTAAYPIRRKHVIEALQSKKRMTTREISEYIYPQELSSPIRQTINQKCRMMLSYLCDQGCIYLVGHGRWDVCIWSLDKSLMDESVIRDKSATSETVRSKIVVALSDIPSASKWELVDDVYGKDAKVTTIDMATLTRALNDLTRLGIIERQGEGRMTKWKKVEA